MTGHDELQPTSRLARGLLARSRVARLVGLAALLVAAGCGGGASASTTGAGGAASAPRTLAAGLGQQAPFRSQTPPGDMAPDYITDANYTSLLIEVAHVEGAALDENALQRLRETLARRLVKPAGVSVILTRAIPAEAARGRTRWQTGDVLALEHRFRRNQTGDASNPTQAVIWIVYLPGQAESDEEGERQLGIAYSSSAIAVFPESIARTTPQEGLETVEAMTLLHESGHLMGLVNNGLPMTRGHEDLESPRHDRSPDCVMRSRLETADAAKLRARPPLDFCYACRLDVYVAGGPRPGSDETAGTLLPPVPALDDAVHPLHPLQAGAEVPLRAAAK